MIARLIISVAILALSVIASQKASAAIITVHYTGTYNGYWYGNYDWQTGDLSVQSGSYPTAAFDLTFTFDSRLAIPGSFSSTHLGNPPTGAPRDPWFPSVGTATFSSSLLHFTAGDVYAWIDAAPGETSEVASGIRDNGKYTSGAAVYINTYSPGIPSSILVPFSISSGLSGSGDLEYDYGLAGLGGGIVFLNLTPQTIAVSVAGVPEASTWAMMTLGFCTIGLIACYRRCALTVV